MKHAEAARILDLADAPPRRSTRAVALGLAILTIAGIFWFAAHEPPPRGSLHSARAAVSFTRSMQPNTKDPRKMKKLMALGVVSTALTATTFAQNAVQWRVEDGGNGHWYANDGVQTCWESARIACEANGGHLATPTSASEDGFIRALIPNEVMGAWLGGLQLPGSCEPGCGWQLITGERWVNLWASGQPENGGGTQRTLTANHNGIHDGWDCDAPMIGIIEWSADCNNDGIVDYGQILSGEFADLNTNNIPDCCESTTACGCPADIFQDNVVNGVDLAAIMNAWGTNGGKIPRCDVDGSGIVDGTDLTIVLDAWGPCP